MINKNASKFFNEISDPRYIYNKSGNLQNDASLTNVSSNSVEPTANRLGVIQQMKELIIGSGDNAIKFVENKIIMGGQNANTATTTVYGGGLIVIRDSTGKKRAGFGKVSLLNS